MVAADYLTHGTAHLRNTTLENRVSELREGGPILSALGKRRVDKITWRSLDAWYERDGQ